MTKVIIEGYVPFKWEDRELLRNQYIRHKDTSKHEYQIGDVSADSNGNMCVFVTGKILSAKVLLRQYVFLDGTPCGKKVEQKPEQSPFSFVIYV